MGVIRCVGCGAEVPDEDGPVHAYMTAAPGCWRLYGELIVRGFSGEAGPGLIQLRTDAYAAQHATNRDPRNRRSVALHLMSLCATFELGMPPGATTALLGSWLDRVSSFPDLTSHPPHGDITVIDVHAAPDEHQLAVLVNAWARSVWDGFRHVHREIGRLLVEVGIGPGRDEVSPVPSSRDH
jgi:hypothetical protein